MKVSAPYSKTVTCPVCKVDVAIEVLMDINPETVTPPTDDSNSSSVTMKTDILNATFSHSCNADMGDVNEA